jgi:DNA-binding SARP family transcriptional activator
MLEIRVLGQFSLREDGRDIEIPSRPAQSLFAYLSLNRGISHRREKLAGLLWPEASESNARAYLRAALWRIRKSFEAAEIDPESFLDISDIEISIPEGAQLWLDADLIAAPPDPEAPNLENMLEIPEVYQGELLPGFYDEWIMLERERLHAAYQNKMRMLIGALLNKRRWNSVLAQAERWINLGYAPEPAYRGLMIAHAALGDLSSMQVAYTRC